MKINNFQKVGFLNHA